MLDTVEFPSVRLCYGFLSTSFKGREIHKIPGYYGIPFCQFCFMLGVHRLCLAKVVIKYQARTCQHHVGVEKGFQELSWECGVTFSIT